jgi:hypothetical protein
VGVPPGSGLVWVGLGEGVAAGRRGGRGRRRERVRECLFVTFSQKVQ